MTIFSVDWSTDTDMHHQRSLKGMFSLSRSPKMDDALKSDRRHPRNKLRTEKQCRWDGSNGQVRGLLPVTQEDHVTNMKPRLDWREYGKTPRMWVRVGKADITDVIDRSRSFYNICSITIKGFTVSYHAPILPAKLLTLYYSTMIDHILGRPSRSLRRAQVFLIIFFWSWRLYIGDIRRHRRLRLRNVGVGQGSRLRGEGKVWGAVDGLVGVGTGKGGILGIMGWVNRKLSEQILNQVSYVTGSFS